MTNSPHILVVEDDREIRALVARYLRANDCRVTQAPDGRQIDALLTDNRFDLVVLDIMLPGEDGLGLCRRIRNHSSIPIIMLTARGDDVDRIVGLEMGADDYMTKPFNPRELLARIKAVLRRGAASSAQTSVRGQFRTMQFAGWTVDLTQRRLHDPRGTEVILTGAEFSLLLVFAERSGRVLSRDQLVDLTRGRAAGPFERSIDVLMSRLRRKLEGVAGDPRIFQTVRSEGYLFLPDVVFA
jgi:two-component system OmpR family response regulator